MKNRVRRWIFNLLSTHSNDPAQVRRARLLGILLLGASFALALLAAIYLIYLLQGRSPIENLALLSAELLGLTLLLIALRLNQIGYTRFAGYIYLIFLTLITAVVSLAQDPDRLVPLYLIPIAAASFITLPHDAFLFAALATALYALTFITHPRPEGLNYYAIISFWLVALPAWNISAQLDNALHRIHQHARELDRRVAAQTQHLQEALDRERTEANKLQAILQSMSEGVIVFDQNKKAIVVNARACDILETSEQDVLGSDLNQILGVVAPPEDQSLIGLLIGGGGSWTASLKVNWGTRALAFSLAPVTLPSVTQQGTVIVLRDITKEAEVEQLKSDLVSLASHELHAPMIAAKGYVDLLVTGAAGVLTDTQFDFLEIVKANCDRLSTVVKGLVDLASLEAGEIKMRFEAVSLRHVILNVLHDLRSRLGDRDIQLDLQVPDGLPEVLADPGRLAQIITSLLSNALKFTFEGKISIVARVVGEQVQVDIADTGIGITERDQTRLFASFFRAPNALALDIPGAGLGLAITRALVEMHGGRIWATSVVGRGSTFSFTVPIFPRPSLELPAAEALGGTGQAPIKTFRILIADGDSSAVQSLRYQLELAGHSVLIATQAAEALQIVEQQQPDLLLLDAIMPDMDGFEALRQLKQNPLTQAVPVIMTSVIPERESGLAAGAADFLTKPIRDEQLFASISRVLLQMDSKMPWSVLVVESDPETRRWLSLVLSGQGLTVLEAQDGEQTTLAMAERRPDLILFGLRLTTRDGWTTLRKLRQNPQVAGVPLILLSTSRVAFRYEGANMLGLGIQQILTKPVSAGVLLREVRRLLLA